MKLSLILAAALLSAPVHAAGPAGASLESSDGSYQVAGLSWRCGKNNPAWWGTFGNGCLKQKRAAKKGAAAMGNTGGFAVNQPLPPPPPPPTRFTR